MRSVSLVVQVVPITTVESILPKVPGVVSEMNGFVNSVALLHNGFAVQLPIPPMQSEVSTC